MTVPFFRGQMIEFTLPHGDNAGESRPAVVTEIVSEEDMICNLVVSKGKANDFTGPPNQFVANVTYDGSKALGTWHQTMCYHGGSTAVCDGDETSDGSADQAAEAEIPAEGEAQADQAETATTDSDTSDVNTTGSDPAEGEAQTEGDDADPPADPDGTDKKTSEEVDS